MLHTQPPQLTSQRPAEREAYKQGLGYIQAFRGAISMMDMLESKDSELIDETSSGGSGSSIFVWRGGKPILHPDNLSSP